MSPTWSIASCAFWTFGSPTEIWVSPIRAISGSETPSVSTRSRMMSIARSTSSPSGPGTAGVPRAS